jgi:hypothetical protein
MSEHTEQDAAAAAGTANTHGPEGRGVEDQAASVGAAAAPCGCGERIDQLEGRAAGLERIARASAYLAMVCAAGLIWLLWFGGPGGDKPGA